MLVITSRESFQKVNHFDRDATNISKILQAFCESLQELR